MPDTFPFQGRDARSNDEERKPYNPPVLHTHGDVISLTQVAYGGLNKSLFGFLFAQSSILLPPPPIR